MSSEASTKQGPLTETVFEFLRTMETLVSAAKPPLAADYWAPLEAFIAVDEFRRRVPEDAFHTGAGDWSKTVMGWTTYRDLFSIWAAGSNTYNNVITRIAEFPGLVYLEIDENHINGENDHVFQSLSIYEFNDSGKICGIRVAPQAQWLTVPAV